MKEFDATQAIIALREHCAAIQANWPADKFEIQIPTSSAFELIAELRSCEKYLPPKRSR